MKFDPVQILTNGNMTGTATINSEIIDCNQVWAYSIQAVYSGTPSGTIKLQASADIVNLGADGSQPTISNWTDLSGTVALSGTAGSSMFTNANFGYRWVRLSYTNSSGTGTLNAVINAKGA